MSDEFLNPVNCPNIVLVGEPRVGKSCLLARLMDTYSVFDEKQRGLFKRPFRERLQTDYTPTSIFSCFMNIEANEFYHVCYSVKMFDTGGRMEFDYLRPMAYLNADVFVYCFDAARKETADAFKKKWLRELKRYEPTVPILFVGIDQGRESDISQCLEIAKNVGGEHIQLKTCSVKTGSGVFEVIEAALALALRHRHGLSRDSQPSRGLFSRNSDQRPRLQSLSMPPDKADPTIEISPSTYADDIGQLLTDTCHTDVKFLFQDGHPPIEAHKVILCSTSAVFRNLFMANGDANTDAPEIFDSISCQCELPGCLGSTKLWKKHVCGTKAEISFKDFIFGKTFCFFLQTLYTGSPNIPRTEEEKHHCNSCVSLASQLDVSKPLKDVISFSIDDVTQEKRFEQEKLVAKANAETTNSLKKFFLNRQTFSDLILVVEGNELHVHKAILCSRSKVMAALLGKAFYENDKEKVELPDLSIDSFLTLLEYLYSDAYSTENSNPVDVMILADRFCLQRFFQICESEISKMLSNLLWKNNEKLVTKTFEVFQVAKTFSAGQLTRWCLKFIALNYTLYRNKAAYKHTIKGEDRTFVETNRWPTQDDMEALRQYKRLMKANQEHVKRCTIS